MPRKRPEFTKSPYFVDEPGNWHLKPGAPKDLQEEFNNYMNSLEVNDEPGTINGVHIEYPYNHWSFTLFKYWEKIDNEWKRMAL